MTKYVAPIEGNEFYAKDLLAELKLQGLDKAWVWQSGGGCATFWIQQEDTDMPFTCGPGSYNWTDAETSIFDTDDLAFSPDYDRWYEKYGEEVEQPSVAPGTSMADLAKLIADEYRRINNNLPKVIPGSGMRTTAELERLIAENTGPDGAGQWDEVLGTLDPKPEQPFYLTDYVGTDECFALVFSNGLVIRIWHPESGPLAFNGDVWDVTPLGWA